MKWKGSHYKDCARAFLEGFWEGFTQDEVWFLLALALLSMIIVIRYGR